MASSSSWLDRLKMVIGPRGYENCMRRSLQTVLLYEAKRCVANRLSSLRPFQRKAVLNDQVLALLESLDFLYPHQKSEILWRTGSSKEAMDADVAWKREKGIEKELETLAQKIKPYVGKASSHTEACNMLVQNLFEGLTGFTNKPYPLNWEHSHKYVSPVWLLPFFLLSRFLPSCFVGWFYLQNRRAHSLSLSLLTIITVRTRARILKVIV
jgi:hypothetical protein